MTEVQSCKVDKCKRTYRAKGYCDTHFKKWRRGELAKAPYKTCNQENCRKKQHLKGLCQDHFNAAYKKEVGAPAVAEAAPSAPAS
ncbi:MAG: hypothetical protein A2048_07745 [Deltaproteobacteria bacterium GWA2_45_12]|nr:MAG: hypothetical protein A2048_07745 [Deltaproteobacteria bacterium GWA2_45_12]